MWQAFVACVRAPMLRFCVPGYKQPRKLYNLYHVGFPADLGIVPIPNGLEDTEVKLHSGTYCCVAMQIGQGFLAMREYIRKC
jgi:hypothetical protein